MLRHALVVHFAKVHVERRPSLLVGLGLRTRMRVVLMLEEGLRIRLGARIVRIGCESKLEQGVLRSKVEVLHLPVARCDRRLRK